MLDFCVNTTEKLVFLYMKKKEGKRNMKKHFKTYLSLLLIVVVCFNLGISTYCQNGSNDRFGGHFEQKDGCAVKYRYYEGENAGWELTFTNPVKWECRSKLKRPFCIKDNSLGTWCKVEDDCQTATATIVATDDPKVDPTPINSSTVITTATVTPKVMPQTGDSNNIVSFYLGLLFLVIGFFIVLNKKFRSAK